MRLALTTVLLLLTFGCIFTLSAQTGAGFEEKGKPIYHLAFVQAKPGKDREYRKFAKQVFQPMWEEAVKAGIMKQFQKAAHLLIGHAKALEVALTFRLIN